MTNAKTGVLLVNLGTPDSPSVPDVRKYLREFLMDKRVVDIPAPIRWALVNLIIAPFRAPKSAKVYKELWEERGSPLMFHGVDVSEMLQERLGEDFIVTLAMRYQSPSIQQGLDELNKACVSKIVVLPLFPQYASATTGSVIDKVMEITMKWQIIPTISYIANFVEEPGFIDTFVEIGQKHMDEEEYDYFLFSYHGLPERQIRKGSVDGYCKLGDCCNTYHKKNQFCYRAQCFETSRQLAKSSISRKRNTKSLFNQGWAKIRGSNLTPMRC